MVLWVVALCSLEKTDVLEDYTTSIFSSKKLTKQETRKKHLVSIFMWFKSYEVKRNIWGVVFSTTESHCIQQHHTLHSNPYIHCQTYIVTILVMTVDRVWISNWSYWMLIFVVTNQSNSSQNCTDYSSLQDTFSLLSLLCLHQSSGTGLSRRAFPFLWVPGMSPCLSYSNS
jgi:hypothetical protein